MYHRRSCPSCRRTVGVRDDPPSVADRGDAAGTGRERCYGKSGREPATVVLERSRATGADGRSYSRSRDTSSTYMNPSLPMPTSMPYSVPTAFAACSTP